MTRSILMEAGRGMNKNSFVTNDYVVILDGFEKLGTRSYYIGTFPFVMVSVEISNDEE